MDLKTKKECVLPKFITNSKPVTPKDSQIKSYSLYKKPVDNQSKLSGNSRSWGDASPEVKSESIKSLLEESMKRGFSKAQASFVLGTSFVESGFNPDAAAAQTSAGGLGQFVKKTAHACGLDGMEVFDMDKAAASTTRYISNIFNKVTKKSPEILEDKLFVESYSHYHDGGKIKPETREKLSEGKVLPLVNEFETWIDEMESAGCMDYEPSLDPEVIKEDKVYTRMGCSL
jgi:hypothetical protein